MSIKSEFGKQLEAYFSGEMKGADRLLFEGRIESDPMLKAEFEHQNEIIESLKAHRTAELKTRLSSITVEPTLVGSLLQSSALKPVVYAISSAAVMTGAYLYYDQSASTELQLTELHGYTEYYTESNLEINKELAIDFRYEPQEYINPEKEEKGTTIETTQPLVKEEAADTQVIAFEVPEIGTDLTTEDFRAPGLSLEEAKKIEEVPSLTRIDKIQISTVNSRRYGFHYRIEDNRLFLYGKFNNSPYEIIELNTPSSKSLFFYYDGSFYNLNKEANEITPLSKIEDTRLTEKLSILKSSSSQ